MTFLSHLEEFRWRLIYAIIGVFIGTAVAWIFIDLLVDNILLKPARDAGTVLQNLKPFGQLILFIQVAVIAGIILSLPNIFYQLWKFIAPALQKTEKKYIFGVVFFTSICFLAGVVFAFFVILPLALQFVSEFGTEDIANNFAINEYMNIIISLMLGAGLVFELPMLSFFLTKLGILTPAFMRKYRRYAIVVLLIFSALFTPPDPASQIMLGVPLVLLYEISIFISKISMKKSV
ncbi:MAG: twin-arginine translocase subunit TatC [Bacteroidetes bacterium]|nr:twin-arginine translocase subunit TatC [Bacteroidota bacterium]